MMTKILIGIALVCAGVTGVILTLKKLPNEDDHLHSIRNVETEEASDIRGAIHRRATWKKIFLTLSSGAIAIGLVLSQIP